MRKSAHRNSEFNDDYTYEVEEILNKKVISGKV